MSDLDDKLMKILGSSINFKGMSDEWYAKHLEDVEKIHQAYKEAGYATFEDALIKATETWAKQTNRMTGQEWYDRFEEELEAMKPPYNVDIYRVAKKAAGLQ